MKTEEDLAKRNIWLENKIIEIYKENEKLKLENEALYEKLMFYRKKGRP